MKKILLSAILLLSSSVMLLCAQNRAPSVYLVYNDNFHGDILINTLRVVAPTPLCTYYNALCFGGSVDGKGYCGMQNSQSGHNFIFSLWDPVSVNDTIKAEYVGVGTDVANFGGEGTGLRTLNYAIGWETNQWYTFVTRIWSLNNHSHYGFWILDHTNNIWHHLVTINYPVNNLKFSSKTSAFIEDWIGNGAEMREIHRKNGWKRKLNAQWIPFNRATISRVYPDSGCVNYIDNYDGGIIDDEYFFIKCGDTNTHPATNVSGTTIFLSDSSTTPDFLIGEISDLIANNHTDSLELQWAVNSTKSPQYSYTVEIYDNSLFMGLPIASFTEIKPHARQTKIQIDILPTGTYYYKIYIHDIFDRRSNELMDSFTGLFDIKENVDISIMPNPAIDKVTIECGIEDSEIYMQIYNIIGNCVMQSVLNTKTNVIDVSSLPVGVYVMRLTATDEIAQKKLIKY